MIIRGVCLRTVDEQRAGGDDSPIEPAMVEIPTYTPLRVEFNGETIGGCVVRLHEGRLWAESSDVNRAPGGYLAIGYLTDGKKVVLTEISIVQNPVDTGATLCEFLS